MQRDLNRDWALRLAEAGMAVFPCGHDKKPLVPWRTLSSSDPKVVATWWHNWPDALPAIDLEKCDLVVLDGDRHGGPDGRVALCELLRRQPDYDNSATPLASTAGDGAHVYFTQNGRKLTNRRGDLPAGIDVRGAGGYVICPYAALPDGRRYRAMPNTPDLIAAYQARSIPPVPEGIVALIEACEKKASKSQQSASAKAESRETSYAQAALESCTWEIASAAPGGRNELLNKLSFRLGRMVARGWLPRERVEANLLGAMHMNGYVKDKGIRAVEATLRSGLEAGLKEPYPDLPDDDESAGAIMENSPELKTARSDDDGKTIQSGLENGEHLPPPALSPQFGELPNSEPWPTIDEAAYCGLVGDIVQTLLPHTEADPIALLIQTLTMAGNVIGRLPHYQVEGDQHRTSLFAVLVGDSAKARKGVSLGRVRSVVKTADELWASDRIKSGLSSGEGFIHAVRDPVEKYDSEEKRTEIVDPGTKDKRLMIVEPEFASAISVAERHGNTLSPLIRRAWDGDKLSTLTRNSPLTATGAHISIVGHITVDELRARINRTELANGFANRFLFVLSRRSKVLPFGGSLTDSEILHLGEKLTRSLEKAKIVGRVAMTDKARSKWAAVYPALSEAKPGLLGAIIARAEAQTIRLALIYALLDGSDQIDLPHLEAALALWEYCELSAVRIFGRAIGDPVADEILQALKHAGPAGMTRTAIRDLFGRNKSGDRIGAALQLLATRNRARAETRVTCGRPAETWFATGR